MPTLRRMPAPVVAPRPLRRRGVDGVHDALALRGSGATSTLVLARLAAVASVVAALVVLTGDVWSYPPAPQLLVDAAVGLGFPVIAAVIAIADVTAGARTLGRVMLVSGVAAAFTALCTALALVLPPDATSTAVLVQLQALLWVPGFFPLITLVPMLYPDGLLPGRVWRLAASGATWGVVLLSVGMCLYPEPFAGPVPVEKPVTSEALALVLTLPGACWWPGVLAGLAPWSCASAPRTGSPADRWECSSCRPPSSWWSRSPRAPSPHRGTCSPRPSRPSCCRSPSVSR